jgi:hypothetical protein
MNKSTEEQNKSPVQSEKKPNETGGFYFSSSIKIFDPETKEILVQKRGDD